MCFSQQVQKSRAGVEGCAASTAGISLQLNPFWNTVCAHVRNRRWDKGKMTWGKQGHQSWCETDTICVWNNTVWNTVTTLGTTYVIPNMRQLQMLCSIDCQRTQTTERKTTCLNRKQSMLKKKKKVLSQRNSSSGKLPSFLLMEVSVVQLSPRVPTYLPGC